jgi:hypothetical protein
MAKSAREKIRLVSSAGTGHFYTTDKNKRLAGFFLHWIFVSEKAHIKSQA